MTRITSSNGVDVRTSVDGRIETHGMKSAGWSTVQPRLAQALREFFRLEADERFGRWRWPDNPDYVVYPEKHRVSNEATGESWRIVPFADPGVTDEARAAYEAWHDARFPKPWREAKTGEVWAVTRCGGAEHPMVVEGEAFVDLKQGEGGRRLAFQLDDKLILRAHRIWPEVSP